MSAGRFELLTLDPAVDLPEIEPDSAAEPDERNLVALHHVADRCRGKRQVHSDSVNVHKALGGHQWWFVVAVGDMCDI
jgi:hypothetical protein